MKLHTLLKDLRERQRLRVDDVAAMLDCSRSAVYAWESGGKGPAPEHLRALADAYNATKKDRADLARLSVFGTDEEPDSTDVEPPGPTRAASLALAFRSARERSSKLREENAALRTEAATMRTWAEEAALAENENARDLEVARQERDEARRMLAECYVLSGADTDGNTPESGWVHLWRGAVEEVRQLRADYDDHSDIERAEREVDRLRGEVERERAAVVAWLRDLAMDSCEWSERAVVYDSCAFAIENGEHRREGEK